MAEGRGTDKQRKALEFFRKHHLSQLPFSLDEFSKATGWTRTSPQTYFSKQYVVFTRKVDGGRYVVTQAFRRYRRWKAFRELVTQTRRAPEYYYKAYDHVRVYEFLLPLSNEEHLKGALDTLFYQDTIRARLGVIPRTVLEREFSRKEGEDDDKYFSRLFRWLSERFSGYSVYHVQGRFRATDLASRAKAAEMEEMGERYLIDETTAIARFIFPCSSQMEADAIHFFFWELFVESIVEVVSGQDQIWMVESGMRDRVHIWKTR